MPKQSRANHCMARDCFAEFTLGLAEGKTRGLAMTISHPRSSITLARTSSSIRRQMRST
jgi:hypothetical protein